VEQVNTGYISTHSDEITVDIVSGEELEINVNEVEMDEMWSFVHDKSQQYWLWWAINHNTGEPLAYTFGTREHKYLDELKKLLSPFKINIVYADDNFAYKKHIKESIVVTGKRNTQKIERHHLSLRTWCSRLVRKGIRFSKTHQMHRIVVGMVINFWLFGKKFLA
jgi:insertion element IS1 protein InsB